MKTIKTKHNQIGYTANLEVIEAALREQFGIDDQSHILRAVAAHIWSVICGKNSAENEKEWSSNDVLEAIAQCDHRLARMTDLVNKEIARSQADKCDKRDCAVGYPPARH